MAPIHGGGTRREQITDGRENTNRQALQEYQKRVNPKGKIPAILIMALPGQWNGVEPVSPDEIPDELEGPVSPGPGGGGRHENCSKKEARAVVSTLR